MKLSEDIPPKEPGKKPACTKLQSVYWCKIFEGSSGLCEIAGCKPVVNKAWCNEMFFNVITAFQVQCLLSHQMCMSADYPLLKAIIDLKGVVKIAGKEFNTEAWKSEADSSIFPPSIRLRAGLYPFYMFWFYFSLTDDLFSFETEMWRAISLRQGVLKHSQSYRFTFPLRVSHNKCKH